MDKLFAANVATSAPTDSGVPGYPSDGDISAGKLPTIPGAYWFWMITAELLTLIVGAGLTPNGATLNQVFAAVTAIANAAAAAAVTTATNTVLSWFTGTNQSLAANGYQKFPGGLIKQRGEYSFSSGSQIVTLTYPIPFPTASWAPRVQVQNPEATSGGANNFVGCTLISHTNSDCLVAIGSVAAGGPNLVVLMDVEGK